MEFVAKDDVVRLLSKSEFIALGDEEKLIYFADRLPLFEKKILLGMVSAGKDSGTEDENNVFTCTEKFHGENGFDALAFQYNITKLVVTKTTSMAYAIWTDLFAHLSTEQAKIMVKNGIVKMHEKNPDLDVESTSLTYGEVDFFSFANILERANPQLGETFVDLGHGTGKG